MFLANLGSRLGERRREWPGDRLLPRVDAGPAASFLDADFVALPQHMCDAGQTVSWYHGPLVPTAYEVRLPLPADALVVYGEDRGLFDVSYAAAWELGRLLALESRQLALVL